ncbi:MAG: hypothetical protein EOP47_04815 [Sphingobacteriaceae bacterium]|nr:MAG: hypothetical protein EOP47_04815 [Sphingobacteriaceae bacterium]
MVIRILSITLLCLMALNGFSQEKSVAGIVFDKSSQFRIAKVNVVNLNTGKSVYNNFNGVFTIEAQPGDELIFKKQDYFSDTIKVDNYLPLAIYMTRTAIQLEEVTIRDSVLNPRDKLALTKKQNSKAYGTLANRDLLVTPRAGGAGGSIDALWNMFSREGKDAEKLRNYIDQDYKQDVIDYRFNRALAGRITGLKDKQLTDFMQKYRPGYYFVIKASELEFIASIKSNLKRYLKNPNAYSLQPLTSSN